MEVSYAAGRETNKIKLKSYRGKKREKLES